ncbi:WecB/TagA/CpsF family glycosyltransferase [Candidatus Roizmanbacteria bacterium]|nr:WecB/TagA/CpsF family glycosyltransferase [Candidatus Roizmanbacteria bacterium]
MMYKGKHKIINNYITACDYSFLVGEIKKAITTKKKLLISPIASHTLVRAYYDNNLNDVLNKFDYLVPDSQWVRWSISFLYGKDKKLNDRVYGPILMQKICLLSSKKRYKVFLYGNTSIVLSSLEAKLKNKFKDLIIIGKEESKFRNLSKKELADLAKKIESLKSDIIFISLGSPKQELFGYELSKLIKKPLIIIPVGAAFDFISGYKKQAPLWMQKIGFEWLYRFLFEPKRLFKRYVFYGLLFLLIIIFNRISKFNYME